MSDETNPFQQIVNNLIEDSEKGYLKLEGDTLVLDDGVQKEAKVMSKPKLEAMQESVFMCILNKQEDRASADGNAECRQSGREVYVKTIRCKRRKPMDICMERPSRSAEKCRGTHHLFECFMHTW